MGAQTKDWYYQRAQEVIERLQKAVPDIVIELPHAAQKTVSSGSEPYGFVMAWIKVQDPPPPVITEPETEPKQ